MICIFSTSVDLSTTEVIRWLHHLGERDVLRVNSDESEDQRPLEVDVASGDLRFRIDGRILHLEDLESVWYRKGGNWLCSSFDRAELAGYGNFSRYIQRKIQAEKATLAEYLHFLIENRAVVLGSFAKGNLNKLRVLDAAKAVGLKTPDFHVTDNEAELSRLLTQGKGYITKALADGLYFFDKEDSHRGYFSYTEEVTPDRHAIPSARFAPSLLQDRIAKQFDLRVFVLDRDLYSMAIFSQSAEQTRNDFRKYIAEKPNRAVPYRLPQEVEDKVLRLFGDLGLRSGSVDFVVGKDDNYYFLEINPVGQFSMVSGPCNYALEKQVAETLLRDAGKQRS